MLKDNALINRNIKKPYSKKTLLKIIHLFLAISVLIWLNAGIYTYLTEYIPNALKLLVFGIWLFIACLKKGYLKSIILKTWTLIFFYSLIILYNCFNQNDTMQILMKNIQYIIIIFSIFLYYFDIKYLKYQKIIIAILALDIIYVGLNTTINLSVNPQLARILSSTPEIQEQLLGMSSIKGIGNYGYFYGLVMVVLILFYKLIYDNKYRFFNGSLCLLSIILIIQAQFTIAILFVFLFVILLLFSKILHSKARIIASILTFFAFVMIYSFLPNILISISNLNGLPSEVSIRFKELANLSLGMEMGGTDLGLRFQLYTQSINAFCSNIITGSVLGIENVGGHSTWLDMLGLYGLFSVMFFTFFIKVFKYMRMQFRGANRMFINKVWLYYAFLGIVNTTLFANIFIILFIFLPFSISILENRNEGEHNENFVDNKCVNRRFM